MGMDRLYQEFRRKIMDIRELMTKIEILKNKLSGNNSDIGDYKVIKIYEARIKGEKDPYDVNALMEARQKIRDQINELQKELKEL